MTYYCYECFSTDGYRISEVKKGVCTHCGWDENHTDYPNFTKQEILHGLDIDKSDIEDKIENLKEELERQRELLSFIKEAYKTLKVKW